MDFAETIRGIFGGQSSQAPPTGEDYASDLKPMVDAGAEVRRKPRLSFDLYPPKPDHDPVLGEELHDILRSRDKVPSPDFIAPPPGLQPASTVPPPQRERDLTESYNTPLDPEKERGFQHWVQDQGLGKNHSYDYDMRGFYNENGPVDREAGAHFTDKYKKPNHATFSTGSQYHGAGDNEGGEWRKLPDGSWTFQPGRTNLAYRSPQELQDYFDRVEQGNRTMPMTAPMQRAPGTLSREQAKGIAASAVEPFGQAGRLATGGSEDVAGDLAGVGAAVAPVPGAGIGKALGKAAKAGVEGAEHAATGHIGDMIKAYHGSPHDFDRFDLSKIGTGEGAQAYGHGLYFAENEGVARDYRNKLSDADAMVLPNKPEYQDLAEAATKLRPPRAVPDDLIRQLQSYADDGSETAARALREIKAGNLSVGHGGRMYEVGIRANPEHFLDWDKPLSEQHPKVQEALDSMGIKTKHSITDDQIAAHRAAGRNGEADFLEGQRHFIESGRQRTGQQVVDSLSRLTGDSLDTLGLDHSGASRRLREAGIPGIKYLDQGSRARPDAALIKQRLAESQQELAQAEKAGNKEEIAYHKQHVDQWQHKLDNPGTRNYVVFDDKLIDILKKYGIAGIGALPAMNAFHYQDKQ